MADTDAERAKRYRDSKRGAPPRKLQECPSYSAHARHKRRMEAGKPSDCTDPDGCREAYNAYQRDMQHKSRSA